MILGYWDSRNLAGRIWLLLNYCRISYSKKTYHSKNGR